MSRRLQIASGVLVVVILAILAWQTYELSVIASDLKTANSSLTNLSTELTSRAKGTKKKAAGATTAPAPSTNQ